MSRKVKLTRLVLVLLASTAIPAHAFAAEPSGATVRVTPAAAASGAAGARELAVEGPIYSGDVIRTDRGGEAQILFRDDTRLVVGPNSRMEIDQFVYNADQSASKVSVDMVKGAFRFISGRGPKQAYAIRTPTMTVGIRGTEFDIAVRAGGETSLALYSGAATVCDAGGTCIDIEGGCTVVVAPPGGGIGTAEPGQQLEQRLATFFPYIAGQGSLAPAFRVDTSACESGGGYSPANETRGDNPISDGPFDEGPRSPPSPPASPPPSPPPPPESPPPPPPSYE